MTKIGILIPVCSRNQGWTTLDETYIMKASVPSLRATMSPGYEYTIYIGVDDDDEFFMTRKDELPGTVVVLSNCRNAPAHAWNRLFERAIQDGNEYFFQMADDVVLETPGWTELFIKTLQTNRNCGVVGPIHPDNYYGRLANGQTPVIENAFVHKTHYEIFRYFYPWEIKNYYCDNWITEVYKNELSVIEQSIVNRNLSIHAAQQRYVIDYPNWEECIQRGREQLNKGCFSFCLYGDYTDKYYKGLLENIKLIHEHYPGWDIHVYAGPEAVDFVASIPDVMFFPTYTHGPINMIYRFLSTLENRYKVVCIRDADSRIHARDRWCIQEFMKSTDSVYTIRDHPWHRYRIMGGLWGTKRGTNVFTPKQFEEYVREHSTMGYTVDTNFLDRFVQTPLLVFSYDPSGLLGNPNEKVVCIEEPIQSDNFCGNVVLFDHYGHQFNEFHT